MNHESKNPICVVWWRDANYSTKSDIPTEMPFLQITTGFVIQSTDSFLNIATSVSFDEKKNSIIPVDGMIIPTEMVVDFKRIANLPTYEEN